MSARPRLPRSPIRLRALAGTALCCLVASFVGSSVGIGPAAAQEAGGAAADADNPVLRRNAPAGFGLDTDRNGMPALRTGRGLAPAFGTPPAVTGENSGGDPTVGLSGGGEGLSRLPRFRTGGVTSGGQSISSLSGTTARTTPSLLRLRAAPPRRLGLPTRAITRRRTQDYVQDLRLTPVIQQPVSGVPLPTPAGIPVIARSLPLLGLITPNSLSPASAFSRLPNDPPDPAYAPLGLRVGTFTVLPAFTQWVGYDTNPDQITPRAARSSAALRSEGEVLYRSDWSSSQLVGELRGGYTEYPDNPEASRPNGAGNTRLRVDINRDTRLDLEGHFVVDTQRAGSVDLLGARPSGRPVFATYGGSAAVTESFNRLELSLRGGIDRQVFEDARLSDGTTLIQSDRDANQYALRLRAAYEISPAITPFVETVLDTRVYDTPVDQFGVRRDSDGIAFTAGARVLVSNTLSGEVSAGLQHRRYVDPSLLPITAPLLNTTLIWAASPLTTVRFTQATGVIETAVPGSSGASTDIAALEIQHDLLRNFSITVGGGYLSNNYQGIRIREHGYSALVRADYRFNRWLTMRGSYIYQTLESTAQSASYDGHIFLMGVRVNP